MSGIDEQDWVNCPKCDGSNIHWLCKIESFRNGIIWFLDPVFNREKRNPKVSRVICSSGFLSYLLDKKERILDEIQVIQCYSCSDLYRLGDRIFEEVIRMMKIEAFKNGIECHGLDPMVVIG